MLPKRIHCYCCSSFSLWSCLGMCNICMFSPAILKTVTSFTVVAIACLKVECEHALDNCLTDLMVFKGERTKTIKIGSQWQVPTKKMRITNVVSGTIIAAIFVATFAQTATSSGIGVGATQVNETCSSCVGIGKMVSSPYTKGNSRFSCYYYHFIDTESAEVLYFMFICVFVFV